MITMSSAAGDGGGGARSGQSVSSFSQMNSIYGMLAQLSFSQEAPSNQKQRSALNGSDSDDSGLMGSWTCFCLSLDRDDWYYDAVENPAPEEIADEILDEIIDDSNHEFSLQDYQRNRAMELRGGYQDEHKSSQSTPQEAATSVKKDVVPDESSFIPLPAPEPPKELPLRFLRAGKGDPEEGRRRYESTLQWRKENNIDTILTSPHPNFELIKKNYPHYYHLKGHNGEPVFFEQPPKTNLQAMRNGGVTLDGLLRHYAMVTEFQWQFIDREDLSRSITVFDLEGMRMMDFVGECVEYVKKCSAFTGQHYPERAGHVLVINVPGWFQMIWKVVKPMVDEVTLKKISILRGKAEVLAALQQKIPLENIPPEYGGKSMPLGESPEEQLMRDLMQHNNAIAAGDRSCGGRPGGCKFCSFVPARSY